LLNVAAQFKANSIKWKLVLFCYYSLLNIYHGGHLSSSATTDFITTGKLCSSICGYVSVYAVSYTHLTLPTN